MNEKDEMIWLDDTEYDPTIDLSSVMNEEDREIIQKKIIEEVKKEMKQR